VNANHHPRALAGKRWKTQNNVGKRSQIGGEELAGVATTLEQPPSLHLRSQGRKEQQTLILEREYSAPRVSI